MVQGTELTTTELLALLAMVVAPLVIAILFSNMPVWPTEDDE